MKKSLLAIIPGLMMIMMAVFAGCASQPTETTGVTEEVAPVVPYSKGPSAPPYVKGPSAPPPGVEVNASEQSVTETDNVKYELPETPTVEVAR